LWVATGQLISAAGGIAGVRVLTGVLDPSSYGQLALGMTAVTLVQLSIMGPLSQACLRYFGLAQESCRVGVFLKGAWRLLREGSLVAAAIAVVAVAFLILVGYSRWVAFAAVAFVLSLISGCSGAVDGVQTAARQRLVVAWHQGLLQWLRPAIAFAAIALLGRTSLAALLGYLVASLAVLASQLTLLWRQILVKEYGVGAAQQSPNDLVGEMRTYAWPFSLWGVVTWLQTASDRWALRVFQDVHSVGVYAAVYQLGYYPMLILSNAISQLVAPAIFSRAGDGSDVSRLAGALKVNVVVVACSLLVTGLAVAATFAFHRSLFGWLVAPEYRPSSVYLPWLALAGGLFASGQAAALMLMTGSKTRVLIAPKVSTGVISVALNFMGARLWGVSGVVSADVVFGAVYLMWVLLVAGRYERTVRQLASTR
jgi:O-antigen/teichoic acid export membrane protein